jgi:hypothetical protein
MAGGLLVYALGGRREKRRLDSEERREKNRLASDERREVRRLVGEERRWRSDRLLERETLALIDLHTSLVDCETSLNTVLMHQEEGLTRERMETEVKPKRDAFMRNAAIASIYLDDEENKAINAMQGQALQALRALDRALRDQKPHGFDDTKLYQAAREATALIRKRLRPKLVSASAPSDGPKRAQ